MIRAGAKLLGCSACIAWLALLLAGCGAAHGHAHTRHRSRTTVTVQTAGGTIPLYLRRRVRPIGRGVRFHPPVRGVPTGACRRRFAPRYQAHIEIFGANKVVLAPPAIGAERPGPLLDGQLTAARCFGNVVTLNPTGIVYVRDGAHVTLQTLFRAWGQKLSATTVASFGEPARRLRVFVDGRPYHGDPGRLRIEPRAEIVIEAGPYVLPHTRFAYPPIPQVS